MLTSSCNGYVKLRTIVIIALLVFSVVGCVRRYDSSRAPDRTIERKQPVEAPISEASPAPDERAIRGFFGPVRRVVSRSYLPSFDGSGRLELYMYSIVVFDRKGGFVSEDFFDAKDVCTSRIIAVRGSTGILIGTESLSGSGVLESKTSYEYDPSIRLSRETHFSSDGTYRGVIVYEYDSEGRISKRLTSSTYQDGSVRDSATSYIYDEDGRLSQEIFSDLDRGSVDLRIEYTYQNGVLVRSSDYQRGLWLDYRTFYIMDRFGNRVQETSFQIPENEYGDSFSTVTSLESFPRSFLSSVTKKEFEYYETR